MGSKPYSTLLQPAKIIKNTGTNGERFVPSNQPHGGRKVVAFYYIYVQFFSLQSDLKVVLFSSIANSHNLAEVPTK
jgi:hypothetical protein